jgi:hypothetical protein
VAHLSTHFTDGLGTTKIGALAHVSKSARRGAPGNLTFTRSADGKVNTYVLWIYDTTITAKKIK